MSSRYCRLCTGLIVSIYPCLGASADLILLSAERSHQVEAINFDGQMMDDFLSPNFGPLDQSLFEFVPGATAMSGQVSDITSTSISGILSTSGTATQAGAEATMSAALLVNFEITESTTFQLDIVQTRDGFGQIIEATMIGIQLLGTQNFPYTNIKGQDDHLSLTLDAGQYQFFATITSWKSDADFFDHEDIVLDVQFAIIPGPGTLAAFGLGFFSIQRRRRRK